MEKRRFVQLMLASPLSAGLAAGPAWAQPQARLPDGTMSIVVPFSAGGISDLIARALAPALSSRLQRTVVVENVVGASGSIAANQVLHAPANGMSLLLGSPNEVILAPLTLKAVRYSPRDFTLIGLTAEGPMAVFVRSGLPVTTLDELVALARKSAGKPLTYGSVGQGSLYHLGADLLVREAGIEAIHVPYKGGMPMLQDLMAGEIDFTVLTVDGPLDKLLATGKLRLIAVNAPQRSPRFPEAPTFAEGRELKALSLPLAWAGVLVSARTPAATAGLLHQAFSAAMAAPEVRKQIEAAGATMPRPRTLAESADYLAQETVRLADMAKAAKLEPS